MKTTLQFKDIQIFGKESDPKEAIIDWDFDIDLIVGSKSNIEFSKSLSLKFISPTILWYCGILFKFGSLNLLLLANNKECKILENV